MIEKLHIKNFQSHKDTELEFSPGVNTIVGSSDNGKSSIWRALNFLINNTPRGSDFVSHWCKNEKGNFKDNTEITLTVDGRNIKRVKGKDNEYYLDDIEKPLEAFKTDVPDPVKELLNTDDINVQHQSDNFFLLNLSSGKVAEELNRLVNLNIIDTTLSNINGKLRKLKAKVATNEEEIEKYSDEVDKYHALGDMEKDIDELAKLMESHEDGCINRDTLGDLFNQIQLTQIEIDKLPDYDKALEEIDWLINEYSKYVEGSNEVEVLADIVEGIEDIDGDGVFSFDFSVEDEIDSLMKDMEDYDGINDRIESIDAIVLALAELSNEIEAVAVDIEKEEKEYEAMRPESCPTCGQSLGGIEL